MSDEAAELIAEAERCLADDDLPGASASCTQAWRRLDDYLGLEAARVQKWTGNVAFLQGRLARAEQAYLSARSILAGLDPFEPDVRIELLRCAADQGQLDLAQGRRTRALAGLTSALQLEDAGVDADSVRLVLARLQLANLNDRATVLTLIDDVAARWPDTATPSLLAIRVHEARGLLAASMDEHESALREFDFVERAAGDARSTLVLARNLQNRAAVLLSESEPDKARELLSEVMAFFGARGYEGLELVATTDKGMVELALGNHEEAAALFRGVDTRYEQTDDVDPRERARNLDGWGNAEQLAGDVGAAAARHGEALSLLDAADARETRDGWTNASWDRVGRARVLSHLATDHLLTSRSRYIARARLLLAEAVDLLAGLDGTAALDEARCQVNLGVACGLLGDFDEAARLFEAASGVFKNRRLLEQVAANHNWGCAIAQSSGQDGARLDQALDLLVPAALVRDSVRHALESSEQRSRWWERQAAASVTEALRVARRVGNASLMTDLILTFRLPGPMELGAAADRPDTWFTTVPSEPSALEPGPRLRLARGPQLRLPDGRISLERYLRLALDQYSREVRTHSVAVIAGEPPHGGGGSIKVVRLDRTGGDASVC